MPGFSAQTRCLFTVLVTIIKWPTSETTGQLISFIELNPKKECRNASGSNLTKSGCAWKPSIQCICQMLCHQLYNAEMPCHELYTLLTLWKARHSPVCPLVSRRPMLHMQAFAGTYRDYRYCYALLLLLLVSLSLSLLSLSLSSSLSILLFYQYNFQYYCYSYYLK